MADDATAIMMSNLIEMTSNCFAQIRLVAALLEANVGVWNGIYYRLVLLQYYMIVALFSVNYNPSR